MYCEKCGKENVEGSAFCQYCGKAISVTESKQSPEAVAQAEPVAQSEALAVPQEEKKESPIKKIYGFLAAVLGLFLIFTVLLPSLGIKNPISNFVADSQNNGKGTSEIEVVVDAYLNAIKHEDVSYLEKYLDENMNYSNLSFSKKDNGLDCSKIDISTAEYTIIDDYTANGIHCLTLQITVKGEGILAGKVTNGRIFTTGIHQAGSDNLWFYGAYEKE